MGACRRALACFSNHGSFALHLAKHAGAVTALDGTVVVNDVAHLPVTVTALVLAILLAA